MKIKVLFDKRATERRLHTGWGVSFLINGNVLFDTGEKGEWLLNNMASLGVDAQKIEAIVISHDHWDHTGGLWEILKQKPGVKVYACPGFSAEFKNEVAALNGRLAESEKFVEVARGVFATGEIPGAYHAKYMPEQALVLKTENGLTVITGCAHPGVLKMVKRVQAQFPEERLYLVIGGFHLSETDKRGVEIITENFKKIGVIKAGPTHCSGEEAEAIFKKHYGQDFVTIEAGQELEV